LVQEKHEALELAARVQKLKGDTSMASGIADLAGDVSQAVSESGGSKLDIVNDIPSTAAKKKKKEKSKKRRRISDSCDDAKVEMQKDGRTSSSHLYSNKRAQEPLSQTVRKPREQIPMSRHVTRSRHIQQKRRAMMDDKSLNEVSILSIYGRQFHLLFLS
jgi:Pin2-interacting protein X1